MNVHPIILNDITMVLGLPLPWDRFCGKTVLISGAAGSLPAYMVESLLHLNTLKQVKCNVICLVRNLKKAQARFICYRGRNDLSFVVGDVSDSLMIKQHCDFVIHAASQASPKYFEADPVGTMSANLFGTHQLLSMARKWKSECFLLFSSAEVYGQPHEEKYPIAEKNYGYIDILQHRACYAESKRAAETLTVSFAHQFGLPVVIVRPFHTYGPCMSLSDGRVYGDFVNDVLERRNIVVRSDGSAVRAFCYLADATAAFFTILLRGETRQAYNVGNPEAVLSIADLAYLLVAIRPKLQLEVVRSEALTAGYIQSPVAKCIPNIESLLHLGWAPQFLPREGFSRTLRYFEESCHNKLMPTNTTKVC